jgi:predicted ABC-type sugar transport system permease subunit
MRHRRVFCFCSHPIRRHRVSDWIQSGGRGVHRHQNKSHSCLRDCASGPPSGFFLGVMTLAYFKAVDTSSGRNLGLQVIAAVVIGGTSLAGGSGTIIGAALGVLIITTIDSGLVFYGVNLNYSEFVTGAVIIGAIAHDRISKRRSSP